MSAGAVVGVALKVRNVITAENDTNLVCRITANLTNAFGELKARHNTSQKHNIGFFVYRCLIKRKRQSGSGLADYRSCQSSSTSERTITQTSAGPPTSAQAEQ